ncbi:MAG: hypothetical protein QOI15_902 [Pseudonocardiales bacterium]|nr:hypothetical protein [Pseudonocardiales bacterium]MDT4920000.1 hypothetical protein [Pseudonocardiales bacterium]
MAAPKPTAPAGRAVAGTSFGMSGVMELWVGTSEGARRRAAAAVQVMVISIGATPSLFDVHARQRRHGSGLWVQAIGA